jgi:hypothetical protein
MNQKSLIAWINNNCWWWQKNLNSQRRALQKNYHNGRLFSKNSILLIFFIPAIFFTIILLIFFESASAQVSSWTPVQISLPSHLSEKLRNQTIPSDGDLHRSTIETVGWTTIFSDDFEGDFPGNWITSDEDGISTSEYHWGKRDCRPYSGDFSAWAVGGGADGSNLNCGDHYPNDAYSWMIYGPFSLEGATSAEFSFNYWLNSELNYDHFKVLASINGSNFFGIQISGQDAEWRDYVFDLTNVYSIGDLTGQPQVWIGFLFTSDNTITCEAGVYVDDVVIRASASQTFTISASAGANGSISPSGDVTVIKGEDQTFNITPDPGYQVGFVDVDGYPVDAVTQYTFTNVQSNHTIYASFEPFTLKVFLPLILNEFPLSPPEIPILNQINNPDGKNNYTVSWQAAANAANYNLQEADNNLFTGASTVYDGPNTSINITSKDVGTYYYRVKAKNADYESGWSNVQSVEVTQALPDTPQSGEWSSEFNQYGEGISWSVSEDGSQVDDLIVTIRWWLCGIMQTTSHLLSAPIIDNQFSKSTDPYDSVSVSVSGTFTSPTSAEATYTAKLTVYYPDYCTETRSGTHLVSPID